MNSLPNAGDRAFVVRVCGCCPKSTALLGRVVLVSLIADADLMVCGHCKRSYGSGEAAIIDSGGGFLRSNLRRIEPLVEPEQVERDEEVPA